MASMIFQIFQTVRACVKRGSGNICSVSVFFVRVGSQISPPPGEQDQLNALPQGQQRQSNPHPMPCPPPPLPAGLTLIGALPYPKTKENKIYTKEKIEPQHFH